MTSGKPTEAGPQPVVAWPGWVWWRGPDGHPRARGPAGEVRAHNFTALLDRIRKAEGKPMGDEIAQLEHLFPGSGWVFGTVWRSAASGPDHRNLTARKGTLLLTAADVPSMAQLIRHEEAGG